VLYKAVPWCVRWVHWLALISIATSQDVRMRTS
jgi:hypothetical protein